MTIEPLTAIARWHDIVSTGDTSQLAELIDREAVFESPVVHRPQIGHALVLGYLTAAASVLGGPGFRYIGEWRSDDGAVLEFETTIDGVTINGVDIIRLSVDGQRIASFKVMVRPLKAVNLIHQLMGAELARAADHSPPSVTSSASGEKGSSPEPG